jgi:23S rRNA pseudouridine2605 synthase
MRVNRYLAAAGCGSRRACDDLVRSGVVAVNGHTLTDLATQIGPDDRVTVRGRPVKQALPVCLALHKPPGILTTCSDPGDRPTVVSLFPAHFGRLFPVGRLDKDSEGLLLLTNDGALSQRLTHPSMGVEKEYEVRLRGELTDEARAKLLRGFVIEGGRGKFARLYPLGENSWRVVLKQGLKRQIRLMFFAVGCEVIRLRRVRIGPLLLGRMAPGEWRQLTRVEVEALSNDASAPPSKLSKKS